MLGRGLEKRFIGENISAIVTDYIKERIMTGKYAEGDHIPQTVIARELEISRGPVREGIKELQNQGVIDFVPRTGNFVACFTTEDKKEIFDIRLMIEGAMLEQLIKESKLGEEDFTHLTKIVEEMVQISECEWDMVEKAAQMSKKDIEFHRYIWKKSGGKRKIEILENLHFQLQMAMIYDTKFGGNLPITAKEHYDIIRCLKTGDIKNCKSVLKEHITLYRKGVF